MKTPKLRKLILCIALATIAGVFLFAGIAFAYWADLNGDGNDEEIKIESAGDWRNPYKEVVAYEGTTERFRKRVGTYCYGLYFGDLDGNPGVEVIAIGSRYMQPEYYHRLYVFGYNGLIRFSYGDYYDLWKSTIIYGFYDFSGDGISELVLSVSTRVGVEYRRAFYLFQYSGTRMSLRGGYPYTLPDGSCQMPVFGDLDRDGGLEMITRCYVTVNIDGILQDRDKFFVFDNNGLLWSKQDNFIDFSSMVAIGDLDGNGGLEVVATGRHYNTLQKYIYAWNHGGAEVLNLECSANGNPTIYDNDEDWKPEVYVGGTKIYESPSMTTNRDAWSTTSTTLYVSYSVSGTVKYQTSGTIVTNATLRILYNGTPGPTTVADGNGEYTFDDVCSGQYTIEVSLPEYSGWISSTPASVSGDNVDGIDIIVPTYSITGTVIYSDGTGVPGVVVSAAGRNSQPSDSSGNYEITGVPNGSHTVTPFKTDNGFDYGFDPVSRTDVPVSNGPTDNIHFYTYNINGYITRYGTSEGINGINVNISGGNSSINVTVPTTTGPGGPGYYEKKGLGAGTYAVEVAN